MSTSGREIEAGLKRAVGIPVFSGNSTLLTPTSNPANQYPRDYYLRDVYLSPAPVISSSHFVPQSLIHHLMRKKRDSAIGSKFVSGSSITDMEGAFHTWVTPILLGKMHGDYHFPGTHSVREFHPIDGKQQARTVIISASIQPDFENTRVMLELCSLSKDKIVGNQLPANFSIISDLAKQSKWERSLYDNTLKAHAIYHLTASHELRAERDAADETFSLHVVTDTVERYIMGLADTDFSFDQLYVMIGRTRKRTVSLEMLFNSAYESFRNELSVLEALCPQGYIYTSDPPSIFAYEMDATLLNRIQFAALKKLADLTELKNMKAFAFNNYADRQAVFYLRKALISQPDIEVLPKSDIFNDGQMQGPKGYRPPQGQEEALLILHNNSDGFGQNIETEHVSSLDGALGVWTSASASLYRTREDLLDHLM